MIKSTKDKLADLVFNFRLANFKTMNEAETRLSYMMGEIECSKIYEEPKLMVNKIILEEKINSILSIFNRKSIHKRISSFFELKDGQYSQLVLRLLKSNEKQNF